MWLCSGGWLLRNSGASRRVPATSRSGSQKRMCRARAIGLSETTGGSDQTQGADRQIDKLDADEWRHDTAGAVEEQVAPQQLFRA